MLFLYGDHTHYITYKDSMDQVRDDGAIASVISEFVVLVLKQWVAPSSIARLDRLLIRVAPMSFVEDFEYFVGECELT